MASIVSEKTDEEGEAREFASAVLTGTVIGRSLQDALQSLSREDTVEKNIYANEDIDDSAPPIQEIIPKRTTATATATVKMTDECLDKILESFREGVVQSKTHPETNMAPRALMKGRCDSYNRYGRNWMVAMDTVKLKERPTKFRKRRRDDRPSLWDRDDDIDVDAKEQNSKKEIVLNEKVQLLAYGDVA